MTTERTNPINLDELAEREVMPGFRGRFVHTADATIAYWRIAEGSGLPEHDHPQAQIVQMREGRFELTVAGNPYVLKAGDIFAIPPGIPHSGRALTACRIDDIFIPARPELGS